MSRSILKSSALLGVSLSMLAIPSSWALDPNESVQALIRKTKSNLVFVKGGTFKMGDFGPITTPDRLPYTSQDESKPLHDVELESFSIGKYKVTYEDFDVYSSDSGTPRIAELRRDRPYRNIPNVPAGVNWQEAKNYCQWLGKVTNLPFDLPTEAQWEYAARSGGKYHAWATDSGKYEDGRNVASYEQRRDMMPGVSSPRVYPVGKFPPNPLGLYDMSSNGRDWVNDWFSRTYYEHSPLRNPQGPITGTEKVLRGIEGDYATAVTMYRQKSPPKKEIRVIDNMPTTDRHPDIGFRCALNSPTPIN
ncbi:formylglycine-generating enzyme family protein [Cupriavidus alkaliphilus]|uniref:formylglycine-generating enzyme family protein n=2 Tax=Cupriavidus alkaliphilus TaxID=942866 RepID=UPI00339D8996